ncbi:MAG: lysozyme inhibitor LprI family protein [Fusobacteriaceae bacterium]
MKLSKLMLVYIFLILSVTSFGGVSEDYERELSKLKKQYEAKLDNDYSTFGMLSAAEDYYNELDKVLNKSYKELRAVLGDEEKIALRDSQREWIKFRDKEIEFSATLYSKKDGTMYRLFTPGMKIELIKNRIDIFVGYLIYEKEEF